MGANDVWLGGLQPLQYNSIVSGSSIMILEPDTIECYRYYNTAVTYIFQCRIYLYRCSCFHSSCCMESSPATGYLIGNIAFGKIYRVRTDRLGVEGPHKHTQS